MQTEQVIADTGYDGDKVIETIEKSGTVCGHSAAENPQGASEYVTHLYRQRSQIERLFGKLKQCRCIATRYEKTSRNFMAFLHWAATMNPLA